MVIQGQIVCGEIRAGGGNTREDGGRVKDYKRGFCGSVLVRSDGPEGRRCTLSGVVAKV